MDFPTKDKDEFRIVGTRPNRPDGVEKVTGRARYGADISAPGMLIGQMLRSPHAHATIKSIDASKAEQLPGVHAVVTAADFSEDVPASQRDTLHNIMARGRALYEGHAVAAVAAVNARVARQALRLIEVDYDVLPHVVEVADAIKPGAPVLHPDMKARGFAPGAEIPPNVSARFEFGHGDVEQGFAEADVIVEKEFSTGAAHQGYIEPHACLGTVNSDGSADLWVTTQGHFPIREMCADILGIERSKLRATASEIGGGFGGKTIVFIEPVALALSRKCGRPVKMVMSREEVFKGSGPTCSTVMRVKIGASKDGRITAAYTDMAFQGGAFPSSPADMGAESAFACYDLEHCQSISYDVVCNRPRAAAYRAPGAPPICFAVESVIDDLAEAVGMDPVDFRIKNAARRGSRSSYGPTFGNIGLVESLERAKSHPHYSAPLGPNQGRGVAAGFWFNFGGQTSVSLTVNADGTVSVSVGTPDIGGSRASTCQMVAEELGIPYENVRSVIADTGTLGFNDATEGSRVTFSTGMAAIQSAKNAAQVMCERAAMMWGIEPEAVEWKDGHARPSGSNAGDFEPLSIAQIARKAGRTGGPISGHSEIDAEGAGVSFGVHMADVEVDPETGHTMVTRYTVIQDAGRAIHPSYVEGQMQGGAAQGIGWALNEEYIYGEDGRLQNTGFLDYRIPVASDLPMIDTVIVEVPNPGHPFGVRGVGEVPIVPPLAAVANAIANATGVRVPDLPISPPKLLAALDAAK